MWYILLLFFNTISQSQNIWLRLRARSTLISWRRGNKCFDVAMHQRLVCFCVDRPFWFWWSSFRGFIWLLLLRHASYQLPSLGTVSLACCIFACRLKLLAPPSYLDDLVPPSSLGNRHPLFFKVASHTLVTTQTSASQIMPLPTMRLFGFNSDSRPLDLRGSCSAPPPSSPAGHCHSRLGRLHIGVLPLCMW
jgi:hypothetical protein